MTELLQLLVVAARQTVVSHEWGVVPPNPGDLVVEVTGLFRPPDPDGIGWLVARGPTRWPAAYTVYDVLPLNPDAVLQDWGGQRWENATFSALPDSWLRRTGIRPPLALFDLIETREG